MSFTSYFDLEIEGRESYWHVRVHDSPGGHGEERVSQRKVEAALQERFRDLLAAVGSTGGSNRLPSKLDIERFGTWLFKAFFVGSVRTAWQGSVPREMGRELQLRLRLDRAPALARLPWEALATARGFLALDEGASIVRYPRVEGGTASGPGCRPFRLRFVGEAPQDLAALEIEAEWNALSTALSSAAGKGSFLLSRATLATLIEEEEPVHGVHFAGHGFFDRVADQGIVFVAGTEGGASARSPLDWMTGLARQQELRLAVFNCCEGARHGAESVTSSLAHAFVQRGVPAVVAMQFPISDEASLAFARSFYESLAAGLAVDRAMTRARRAIQKVSAQEWISPVLFLREGTGEIMDPGVDRTAERSWPERILRAVAGRTRRQPKGALAFATCALLGLFVGIFHSFLAERWWRAERRTSEPPASRTARVPLFDPALSCPKLPGTGIDLVLIPGGELIPARQGGEGEPFALQPLKIAPFCIAKTEISQRQWGAIEGSNPSALVGDDLPVNAVPWDEAQGFLAKLNRRYPGASCSLPTGAQFEYVAGVGKGRPYGIHGPELWARYYANCATNRDGFVHLAPVDEFPANEWGVAGLVGNASEWVEAGGTPPCLAGAGPPAVPKRERRGGSYLNGPRSCRSSACIRTTEISRLRQIGFRVVCAPQVSSNP